MNPSNSTPTRREPPSPPAGGAGAVIGTGIRDRWRLAFVYEGHPRVVDPHIYGVLTTGLLALSGYQVGGSSRAGKVPDWRTFHLESIEQLEILEESSRIRGDYNPDDPQFAKVYSQV
jgi:hypothetical protein